MDIVRSRAARTLSRLPGYRDLTRESAEVPDWLRDVPQWENESVLGIYENVPGVPDHNVVVTSLGLHVRRDATWRFLPYREMRSIDTPSIRESSDKTSLAELSVRMANGDTVLLPISGGEGGLRDAWEFLRFLRRVTEALKLESRAGQTQ